MKNLPATVLLVETIAGTLDVFAAIIVLAGGNVVGTLKYIAAGALGRPVVSKG